ncbi:MAG: ATP-dependent helicase [Gracilimonas sp.]|uniref:ATP-dependent DNA helicase n=1 Tax=Gracilimonas sp. TaxID=1974203 RepID=UPI0019C2DB81|nr:ATP-dependent DNA helicase [Gracilimonas sp.]MBD3617538.1 ATP-dependent helicase [Gracilimonas sp.]
MPDIQQVLTDNLTNDQFNAANDAANEILCLACAGSGKSRTLAYRIARLIAEGEPPSSIVAFTFTNRAAESIKMRVADALSSSGIDPKVLGAMYLGTIDSYCGYILGEINADYRQYDMLDPNKLTLFIMSRSRELNIYQLKSSRSNRGYFDTVKQVREAWNTLNNEMLDVEDVSTHDPMLGETLSELRNLLHRDKFIDFSYAQRLAIEELENAENAERVLLGIKHLMVDEYQDVNPAQESLIAKIHDYSDTLFVVGDDDQSIYSWRGADVNNILEFPERYPNSTRHELTTNFRSLPNIIEASSHFVEDQLGAARFSKTPQAADINEDLPGQTGKIWFDSREEEANWVSERIQFLLGKSYFENSTEDIRGLTPGDFAILMRSTHGSGEEPRHIDFTRALEDSGIPYFIETEDTIFSHAPVLALKETFSLLRDGNPSRGAVRELFNERILSVFPETQFRDFTRLMSVWGRLIHGGHGGVRRKVYPQELVHQCLEVFKYDESNFDYMDNKALGVFSSIMLDVESVYMSIDSTSRFREVLNFLDNVAESGYQTTQDIVLQKPDRVFVSTVHKAKGLEFPVVFIVDLEQRRFPGDVDRSFKGWIPIEMIGEAFEAGRYANTRENDIRLFYTAVTRAERYLYMTGSSHLPNGRSERKKSVFLDEFENDTITDNAELLPESISDTEPIQRIDDNIKPTSFTEVKYYLRCPKEYQFRKQYGFNPSVPELFGFGQTTHASIAKLHELYRDNRPTEDQISNTVDQIFHLKHVPQSNDPENNPGPFERAKESTRSIITEYVEKHGDDFEKERRVEVRFEIPAENTVISGAIDLMLQENEEGEIEDATVIDFKSMELGEGESLDWISLSLQVQLYALAATQVLGENAKTGQLHFLKDNERVELPVHDEALDRALKNIEWAVKGIIARDYPMRPHPDKCAECDFSRFCTKQIQEFNTVDLPPPIFTPEEEIMIGSFSKIEE